MLPQRDEAQSQRDRGHRQHDVGAVDEDLAEADVIDGALFREHRHPERGEAGEAEGDVHETCDLGDGGHGLRTCTNYINSYIACERGYVNSYIVPDAVAVRRAAEY